MGLYSGGFIIEMIFASEVWGAYFREGLFLGGAYDRNFTVFSKQLALIFQFKKIFVTKGIVIHLYTDVFDNQWTFKSQGYQLKTLFLVDAEGFVYLTTFWTDASIFQKRTNNHCTEVV